MDNRSDLFDLMHEKRELDIFLSTIPEIESSAPPAKDSSPKPEPAAVVSKPLEIKLPDAPLKLEISKEKLEPPEIKTEPIAKSSAIEDITSALAINEFIPKPATDQTATMISSSFLTLKDQVTSDHKYSDRKMADTMPMAGGPSMKTIESRKTMTPMDGTVKLEKFVASHESSAGKKSPDSSYKSDKNKIDKHTPEKESSGKRKIVWIAAIIIIFFIIIVIGYLSLYPERGDRVVQWIKSTVPFIGNTLPGEQVQKFSSVEQVRLTNIRQRLVSNSQMGKSIRVIEGIAESQATFDISKIKVFAELYSSEGAQIASVEAFCGNIISDDKLESLDKNKIQANLLMLQTGGPANSKIPPRGKIPFMIVFVSEPAGVFKLTVSPIAFDKN